ncbi:MAG: SPOR domain-containing protein [Terriglobales bacterium]|jgi:DedD protein
MPTSSQDTEITLGTGRMLALFFTFVLVCAVFFAIGFSLGRKTSIVSASNVLNAAQAAPATVVRPSAAKDAASQPAPQTTDFSFYKSVGAKTTDTDLKPAEAQPQPVSADPSKTPIPAVGSTSTTGSYFVQVAAVTRHEDADALVQALQKKQYPAFTANNAANDKFYHVQVGPYAELKDAEAMRARLVADGYNPIVKK